MALDGGDRNLREHEGGAPELCQSSTTEGLLREAPKAGLKALRLTSHAAFQSCRPISLDKVVTAEQQQQAGIVKMQACPSRRVERGGKSIRLLCAVAEKIGKARYCWLLTAAAAGGTRARPMGRVPRDADEEEWTLRFLTDGLSPKVADLRRVGSASVIFQHDPDDAFVTLAGTASLAEGKPEIHRRWEAAYRYLFS
jgi:general stress protein 26